MFEPHLVEWAIVPMALYLFIFSLRDNLNILHMPLADFVALFVIADVAMALHCGEIDQYFVDHKLPLVPNSPQRWWILAAIGTAICGFLVYGIENRIKKTAIHHMTVGPSRHKWVYCPARTALRSQRWRRFAKRWASSFGVAAIVVGLHAIAFGRSPIEFVRRYYPVERLNAVVELGLLALGIYCTFYVLAVVLTFVRVFRFSEEPLPWTIRDDYQDPPRA